MKKAKTLSDSQFSKLFKYTGNNNHGLRNQTILVMSFKCGLRAKELASLKISDVMNDENKIKEELQLLKSYTKGDKHRTIYLTNTKVRKILLEWINFRMITDNNLFSLDAPLFKSQKGYHFSANSMAQLVSRILKNAGAEFQDCSSHSGRRTLITNMVNNGISVNKVQKIAGHSNIATTMEYVDTNSVDLANIMKNI